MDSSRSSCAVSCVAGQKRSIIVISLKLCCKSLLRLLVVLAIISSLFVSPALCQETEDSQVFIAGFNAYQQKNYAVSIEKMNEVLQKYPDSPLRDMALFWLARSYFKAGNQREAARYLSQFSKEYPDNSLKSTVEDELLSLTARYEKGEKLPVGSPPVKQPDSQADKKGLKSAASVESVPKEEATGRQAQLEAEETRLVQQKLAEEKATAAKLVYREKAIVQYKTIIERFPASAAAVTAAAKLRELGVSGALPVPAPVPDAQKLFETAVKAYRQDDCRTALELLDRYLADNSGSPLAADATLYKAECYLKLSVQ